MAESLGISLVASRLSYCLAINQRHAKRETRIIVKGKRESCHGRLSSRSRKHEATSTASRAQLRPTLRRGNGGWEGGRRGAKGKNESRDSRSQTVGSRSFPARFSPRERGEERRGERRSAITLVRGPCASVVSLRCAALCGGTFVTFRRDAK